MRTKVNGPNPLNYVGVTYSESRLTATLWELSNATGENILKLMETRHIKSMLSLLSTEARADLGTLEMLFKEMPDESRRTGTLLTFCVELSLELNRQLNVKSLHCHFVTSMVLNLRDMPKELIAKIKALQR